MIFQNLNLPNNWKLGSNRFSINKPHFELYIKPIGEFNGQPLPFDQILVSKSYPVFNRNQSSFNLLYFKFRIQYYLLNYQNKCNLIY